MKKLSYVILFLTLSLNAVEFIVTNKSNDTISVFFNFSTLDNDGNIDQWNIPYEIANQNYSLKPQERKVIKLKTLQNGKNYTVEGISAATSKLVKGTYPITEDKKNKNLTVFITIKTLPNSMGGQVQEMPYFEVKTLK